MLHRDTCDRSPLKQTSAVTFVLHYRPVQISSNLQNGRRLELAMREMAARSLRRHGISNLQKAITGLSVLLIFRLFKTANNLPSSFSRQRTEAKIAFFIQVSSETVLHVPRILKALHHPENIYAIHLDTRISAQRASLIKSLLRGDESYNNVVIIPSERISYAGVTMLLNTLNALEILLQVSPDWDFFINLSGADYPLVSPHALRTLLAIPTVRMGRLNMLQRQEADRDTAWFFKKRLGTLHLDPALYPSLSSNVSGVLDTEIAHPMSRMLPNATTFVKSEGWVILHRSFSEHAVHSAQGRRLLLSYATARAPDELFFGSLLESSEFRTTVAWDAMRYIVWGLHGVRWSRPAFLEEHDSDIRGDLVSSGALFARKFAQPESDLLDFIDASISGISEDSDDNAVDEFFQCAKTRIACIAEKRHSEACANEE